MLAMMEEKVAKQQELRKSCDDRKRGIDAIISRLNEPAEVAKYEKKKKDIETKTEEDLRDTENDYARKEARIMREV